jgi:hypothetical protein
LVGDDHCRKGRQRKMLTRGGPLMEAATEGSGVLEFFRNLLRPLASRAAP